MLMFSFRLNICKFVIFFLCAKGAPAPAPAPAEG